MPYGKTRIYDASGTEISGSAIGNPYMFTARRMDAESGLYYYRARMYAPEIGRFLQTDPLGYIDTINPYAYCGNNPLNWIDPSGGKTTSIGIGGSAGFFGGVTVGFGFTWDDDGNLGIYFFHGAGAMTPSVSLGGEVTKTDGDTIDDLCGTSIQTGCGAGLIGGEAVTNDPTDFGGSEASPPAKSVRGGTVGLYLSPAPAEAHLTTTDTTIITIKKKRKCH